MVDTWATVGSCAQIGRDCHLAGGVGIGGVLEPPGAQPVIVEDGAFIGSRAIVVEGMRVGREAVIGAGVVLTASTAILDVTGPEVVEHRGRVPAAQRRHPRRSRPKKFPAGEFGVPCALIIGKRSASDRPQGEPQRGAPRLRRARVSERRRRRIPRSEAPRRDAPLALRDRFAHRRGAGPVRRGRGARCERSPLAGPIRRYGDSIVVAARRAARRRRGRTIALVGPPRHGAHRERPGAHRGRPLLRRRRERHEERPRAS